MTSNLACVGLFADAVDDFEALLDRVLPAAVEIGSADGIRVLRWEDPSGARMVLGVAPHGVIDVLPSFAGRPRAHLQDLRRLSDDVAIAAVVDGEGDQLTSATLEVEERRLLPAGGTPPVTAAIVALGVDVAMFADAAAFSESDASLLSADDAGSDPPEDHVAHGWPWPPRLAAESFISYGVFEEPSAATAYARLSGVVRTAERRVVELTRQGFVVAEVSTCGFDVTVCLPDGSPVPMPGAVLSGTVFLTASVDGLPEPAAAPPKRQGLLGRIRGQRSA